MGLAQFSELDLITHSIYHFGMMTMKRLSNGFGGSYTQKMEQGTVPEIESPAPDIKKGMKKVLKSSDREAFLAKVEERMKNAHK